MRLLLDSHAILWTLYDPDHLPVTTRDALANPSNHLFVSHVSVLELANKAAARRLPLVGPSTQSLLLRIRQLAPTFLPITLEDILSAANLPQHHLDPLDRILVAQAQSLGLTLVTKDGDIPKYDVEILWK